MTKESELSYQLRLQIISLGYPDEFARVVAGQLHSERSLKRMLGYLRLSNHPSPEEIADELLAILDENESWKQKKSSEYYNMKYNAFLNDFSLRNNDTED